ncbi:MAG: O-antigen ligase family protein [Saprospiraceae bacterium]
MINRKWLNHQSVGIFGILMVLVSMVISADAWTSIGMMVLTANGVFNKNITSNFKIFIQNRALIALTIIFFIVLLSGLWSENTDWLLNRLQMKFPFLLMPFAIIAIPKFDKNIYYPILSVFFWLTVVICIYSLSLYLLNFEQMTEAYKQGHVLYTPVMHIRFSLIVAYCIIIGGWLFYENYYIKFPAERWLLLGATIFLFIYIHILAVRSGLVSLYAVAVYLIIYLIIRSKRYILGASLAGLLIIGGILAVRFVPTLWNKYNYMRWSINQFQRGEDLAVLSDSYRLATIKAGIDLGNANLLLGVGFGDMKDETKAYLAKHYPALLQEIYMPQSEYVLFYAATGIIGLLLFIWATLQPFFYQNAWQYLLIGGFHVIMIVSFIVEQTLETQLGTAIYVMFAVMGIRFLMEMNKMGHRLLRS